ncbi:MAG TPA: asparagine synthetase B, partial [Candidatus Paceibacterota bacterium]
MVERLRHRGPDDSGVWSGRECSLGHARLSIVDLSTGSQPMHSGDTVVTFNGEIFGYQTIRKELSEQYRFKTASDTEVILALYKKYGDEFVKQLPGQFAFALWDEKQKKLLCARDRFGEKPLFY